MGSCIVGFKAMYIDWFFVTYIILTQLNYKPMWLINPSFLLLDGLSDIVLTLMNSGVVSMVYLMIYELCLFDI